MNKLKGIVFDLDGTLVNSLGLTFEAFDHAIARLGGRSHTRTEIIAHFGTGELQIFAAILGRDKAEAAYGVYREYVSQNLHRAKLHDGVGDLLEAVKTQGLPVSVFTGRSWNTTEAILKHHGLLDRFVTVVANDHVQLPKPSPEGLQLALERMRMEPSEVLFVGDMAVDIQAAHSAGTQSAAALWDLLVCREELEALSPHYWAEDPAQLWEICRELTSTPAVMA